MEGKQGEVLWMHGAPIGTWECIDEARFRGERLRLYRCLENPDAPRVILSADTGRIWLRTEEDTIRRAIEEELGEA